MKLGPVACTYKLPISIIHHHKEIFALYLPLILSVTNSAKMSLILLIYYSTTWAIPFIH